MAILQGEAARKWLEENKGKDYRDLNTGKMVSGQRSGVGNFLLGMSKPFRMVGGLTQEAMMDLANAAARSRGQTEHYKKEDRPLQNAFITGTETEEMRKDPLMAAAKSAAGIGSFFIPGGSAVKGLGGIARATGKGIASGLAGGFGYSREGKELEDTFKGGLIGGVIGGGLQSVKEGARALGSAKRGQVPSTLSVEEIGELPKKVKTGLKNQAKAAHIWDDTLSETENFQIFLQNRNLAGRTAEETLENITKELSNAQKTKTSGLEKIGKVSDDTLIQANNRFKQSVSQGGFSVTGEDSNIYNNIEKVLSGKAGVKDAAALDKIAQRWEDAGRKASGVGKTTTSGLYVDGAKALKDTLRSLPNAANYDKGLERIAQLYKLEELGTVQKGALATTKTGVHPPFTQSANISIAPVARAGDRARAALGSMQELGVSMSPELSGGIQRVAGLGQRAGVTPGLIGAGSIQPQQEEADVQLSQLGMGGATPTQSYTIEDGIRDAYQILPNASEAQIITLAKALVTQNAGSQNEMVKSAFSIVDQIEQLVGSTNLAKTPIGGKISAPFKQLGASTGLAPDIEIYNDTKKGLATMLSKALGESGRLTDQDIERAVNMLPKISDSEEMAVQRLTNLRAFLYNRMGLSQEEIAGIQGAQSPSMTYDYEQDWQN